MSQTEARYRFIPSGEVDVDDLVVYGGVEFPRFLITQQSFASKLAKSTEISDHVRQERAKGTATEDAGDTHGQYHNEYEWYRDQDLELRASLARSIGGNLDRATVVEDYSLVKEVLESMGVRPNQVVTLTSQVSIQYGSDPDDVESILLVAPLDGGMAAGWVSIETPLAKVLEGRRAGETLPMKVGDERTSIKIVSIR